MGNNTQFDTQDRTFYGGDLSRSRGLSLNVPTAVNSCSIN